MTSRLTSAMLVSALIRKVEGEGGTGAVLARGDSSAGALLLLIADRGQTVALRERGLRPDGRPGWISAGPSDPGDHEELSGYLERRRKFDADLWLVELDGMSPEAFDQVLAEI
jgi:hypothetical protein